MKMTRGKTFISYYERYTYKWNIIASKDLHFNALFRYLCSTAFSLHIVHVLLLPSAGGVKTVDMLALFSASNNSFYI